MKHKIFRPCLAIIAIVLIGTSLAVAQTIQNPSFEMPIVGTPGNYLSFEYNPSGASWVFTDNAGIAANGSGFVFLAYRPGTSYGNQVAFLEGKNSTGGEMSQTVTITNTGYYALSFYASQRDIAGRDNSQNQTLTVSIDGEPIGSFTPADDNWYSYQIPTNLVFAGDHLLEFSVPGLTGDATVLVDEVSITGTQVATNPLPTGFTVLHDFNGNPDGGEPFGGLAYFNNQLIGSTVIGGTYFAGTIFSLNTDGSDFSVIHQLTNTPDAGNPVGDLLIVGNEFFGTSADGGKSGAGTVYVGTANGTGSLIHSFSAVDPNTQTNADGADPNGSLVLLNGSLFGTAGNGGYYAEGAIFSVTTNGATGSLLHSFSALDMDTGTNQDGATPSGGLVLSGSTLFGTASTGGTNGSGTIFSIRSDNNVLTVLHNFSALYFASNTNAEGESPRGTLLFSGNTLYGIAGYGGTGGAGTIFSVQTNGSNFTVLHQFSPPDSQSGTNTDGATPGSSLILSNGILYGTASLGGAGGSGTIFSLSTNGQNFTTLYSFTAVDPNTGLNQDGSRPQNDLLLLNNTLYGTASAGGNIGAGTIFSLALSAPRPTISGIAVNSSNGLTLSFVSPIGSTNFIMAATNFPSANWFPIYTNVTGGNWQFNDTNTASFSAKFYRVATP